MQNISNGKGRHSIAYLLTLPFFLLFSSSSGEAAGASVDFTYDTLGIKYSFGIELRDNGQHGTLLPSDQILPNAEESWVAVKEMAFIIIDQIYMEEGYTNI